MEPTLSAAAKHEIKLADYLPPDFSLDHTSLTFHLFDDHAVVVAATQFRRSNAAQKGLVLDGGSYMELVDITLDDHALGDSDYAVSASRLEIFNVPDTFTLCVTTRLLPRENTRLEGLYFSGGNFCTQCEAEGFRHITYFLDRPDALTCYDVRIEADHKSCPVLLSNGNPGAAGMLDGGRHYAEWHDPHPKPCYLFALVAGDLACQNAIFQTKSGRSVALNVYVEPKEIDKTDHAIKSLQKSMKWDEDRFGLEYDLDVYNIVAVSDFNMGAMENKGLNVFNTKYVLASSETATDTDFENIEGVIGHEYFHNWTGNRVTCRDWFQLSLKEGLTVFRDQEFSSDMGSRALKRIADVRALRLLQFSEDAGPLAHPIRPEKYIEINNFYTATVYNKGAEVIRMMHMLIGEAAFCRGMDLYFERHDGQAVTCEDFVQSMEDASGVDLNQFRLWYSQAGTPRLQVSCRRKGVALHMTFEQSCPATPGQAEKKALHMPVLLGWIDVDGQPITPDVEGGGQWRADGCLIELTKPCHTVKFRNVPEGAVPSILRQFSAPVKLETDLTAEDLAFLMQHDPDSFARWEAAQGLASRVILEEIEGSEEAEYSKICYHHAFRGLLEKANMDSSLLAELLTLPSESDLGQKMRVFDAAKLHRHREALLVELARKNQAALGTLYSSLEVSETYSLRQKEKGLRRLRNGLLGYLAVLGEGDIFVQDHYKRADNMTDRMAALSLAAHSDFDCREDLLEDFYSKYQDDALVIDKWFAVQAQSKRADTLSRVQSLTQHSAFSYKNPNRLRALVSTFSMLNQARFHNADGEGYRFLANTIIAVDALNPQTAARLIAPLGRWARMPASAAESMKKSLEFILSSTQLSDDVRELCTKSLG